MQIEELAANNSTSDNESFYTNAESIEYAKKLTIEQIRSDENFKNISDEQALEIIDGLYKLSLITYKIYSNNGN